MNNLCEKKFLCVTRKLLAAGVALSLTFTPASPSSFAGSVTVSPKTNSITVQTRVKLLASVLNFSSPEETLLDLLPKTPAGDLKVVTKVKGWNLNYQGKRYTQYNVLYLVNKTNSEGSISKSYFWQFLFYCPGDGTWTSKLSRTYKRTEASLTFAVKALVSETHNVLFEKTVILRSVLMRKESKIGKEEKYEISYRLPNSKEVKKMTVVRKKEGSNWQYQNANAQVLAAQVRSVKDRAFSLVERLAQAEGVTLADAKEMRSVQVEFKKAIEALAQDSRAAWSTLFKEYLSKSDEILAMKKLLVVLSDGKRLMADATYLITEIYKWYKQMDDSDGKPNLDRFAGIDAKDLQNLDSAKNYFNDRQVGSAFDLPVTDVYSPLGNLELVDRLVRKFKLADLSILGYIDGTEPLLQEANRTIQTIFSRNLVNLPNDQWTLSSLQKAVSQFGQLNQELKNALVAIINRFTGEEVFKNLLRSKIGRSVNGENYLELWERFQRKIGATTYPYWRRSDEWHSLNPPLPISFTVGGKTVKLSARQILTNFNFLRSDSKTFLKFPGIKDQITFEMLEEANLIPQSVFNALSSVNVYPPSNNQPENSEEVIYFSHPAKLQLVGMILNLFPQVVNEDGSINFRQLRYEVLINSEIGAALEETQALIEGKIEEMSAFGEREGISHEDYQAMKELLASASKEAHEILDPVVNEVNVWQVTSEANSRLEEQLSHLKEKFDAILSKANALVEIDSESLVFDPRMIENEVLETVLKATAIRPEGRIAVRGFRDLSDPLSRFQYIRLEGIDEDMFKGIPDSFLINYQDPEMWFNVIPQIVAKHKTAEVDALIKAVLGGMEPPVALGKNLWQVIGKIVDDLTIQALKDMKAVSVKSIDDLLKMKAVMVELNFALKEKLASYLSGLADEEISEIQGMIHGRYYPYPDRNSGVGGYFEAQPKDPVLYSKGGVKIPVGEIGWIPNFPYSTNYNQDLFVGILPSDFEGVEMAHESRYDQFNFNLDENEFQESDYLSGIGQVQLVMNIVERLLNGGTPEDVTDPAIKKIFIQVAANSEGPWRIDVEEFRKYIKGVRAMQKATIAEAQSIAEKAKERIEEGRQAHLTIDQVNGLYDIVLQAQKDILGLLKKQAEIHEPQDVDEIEKTLSKIYQETVFKTFVPVVGDAKLVTTLDGKSITIPVKAIADKLVGFLKQKFGDSMAAHSFSYFHGLSMDVIRNLHRMEQYLSQQVIALPRNTTGVKVVSQFSELGFMQLAAMLVDRFGRDILTQGQVNLDKLFSLLQNRDRGVIWIKGRANEIADKRMAELEALDQPLSLENLDKISLVMENAKQDLVMLMTDFVSGKTDAEDLAKELTPIINDHYARLKKTRDLIVTHQPFVYKVDIGGLEQEVSFYFNEETLGRFKEFAAQYAMDHPGTVSDDDDQIIYHSDSIRHPYPGYRFNPRHHVTDFGMTVLFARLVVKFGHFVVRNPPNCFTTPCDFPYTFNMDDFMEEILKKDSDRTIRRLDAFGYDKTRSASSFLSGLKGHRSDGPLPLEKIGEVNGYFSKIRENLMKMLPYSRDKDSSAVYNKAREVWGEIMKVYEENLFEGLISFVEDGKTYTFKPSELDEALMKVYGQGMEVPKPLATWLKEMKKNIRKGEDKWTYYSFRNIFHWYDYGLYVENFNRENSSENEQGTQNTSGVNRIADLLMIPGVCAQDFRGPLDVAEKDALKITPMDPKLIGELDVRAITLGSGVDIGGLLRSVSESLSSRSRYFSWQILNSKSKRFRMFELIPALIKKIGAARLVTSGNRIDASLFEQKLKS